VIASTAIKGWPSRHLFRPARRGHIPFGRYRKAVGRVGLGLGLGLELEFGLGLLRVS
jgi:hypothetical protein